MSGAGTTGDEGAVPEPGAGTTGDEGAVPEPGADEGALPKVLFILGKGRSGSTVLDNVLGGVEGFFTAGELLFLWDWGLIRGYRCGCGVPVRECPVWTAVVARALPGGSPSPGEVLALQRRVVRWHQAPRLLRAEPQRLGGWAELRRWSEVMGRVYASLAAETGARVVVDASKMPVNPAALGFVPGIEPYVVQLVRDPRAVAHSWRRRKPWSDRDGGEMPRFGALHSALSWTARNLAAEWVRRRVGPGRSMLLRYEDFAARPRETVAELVRFVDEEGSGLPFSSETVARLGPTHTVGGNPDRVERAEVEVRPDDEWRGEARRVDRLVVGALTAPLLRRYGYPLGVA